MISSTIAINAITRIQGKLLTIEEKSGPTDTKAKGNKVMKDVLGEHQKLATKLIEEIAKLRPEQPESLVALDVTKVPPKSFSKPHKASKPGT